MSEVICTDGKFEAGALEFYQRFGVSIPVEGTIYTIRNIQRHSNGEVGIRLVEIVNPDVPIVNEIMGTIFIEPSFHVRRFAHLNGDPLTLASAELMEDKQPYKTFFPVN